MAENVVAQDSVQTETPVDESKNSEAMSKNEDVEARIAKAVEEAKEKWKQDYEKKVAAKKKEAERLAKLSEDERQKAELESTRKALEDREAELSRKELRLEMVKVLADRKLPVSFMDYLLAENSEETMKRIQTFEKQYKKAVEDGVNERLKGHAPQASGTSSKGASMKGSFMAAILKIL